MRSSLPTWYSALFSCVAHTLALGLAAAVQLRSVQPPISLLKVELHFQQAVPLPVGDLDPPGASTLPPAPEPRPAAKPPLEPQPKPKVKPSPPQKATSKPKPQPPASPPPVIAATTPTEIPPIAPPTTNAPPEDGDAEGRQNEAGGNSQQGVGGSQGKTGTGAGGGSTHGSGGGSSAHPDYGVNPKPPYPLLARRMGTQGVVFLRVHVRADGSVAAAEVTTSSGSALLDDSAVKTVRDQWRFLPALLDGTPVESWVEVPIRFVLNGS